jgi:hypothetical protein
MASSFQIWTLDINDPTNLYERWQMWITRFERILKDANIRDDDHKINKFFLAAGPEVENRYVRITNGVYANRYDEVKAKIAEICTPTEMSHIKNMEFRRLFQFEHEKFDDFVDRLVNMASQCNFGDRKNEEIKSMVIQGCKSSTLRRKILEKSSEKFKSDGTDISLETAIELGRMDEAINTNCQIMESQTQKSQPSAEANVNAIKEKRICIRCGGEYPHKGKCPAFGKTCSKCNKPNHFAKQCKSTQTNKTRKINMVKYDTESENESHIWSIRVKKTINAIKNFFMPLITLLICQTSVSFAIDTGAQVNLIDESTYNKLKIKPKLYKCNTSLYSYNNHKPIDVIGQFYTRVLLKGIFHKVCFVVVKGSAGNLISYQTSVEMGIVNEIKQIQTDDQKLNKWKSKYPEVFVDKVGKFKNDQVKLHIDKTVQPVKGKLRTVPFHLREKVENEIKKMLENDLIEPVNGPTPWVSPIVVVAKNENKIRICTDAREANRAIQRQRHNTPTIDDLLHKLNGAKVFSKIDLNSGYHQLELHPDSRYITAFCTHLGIFQYKRLNFGINTAAEIFQKKVEELISGIDHCINISDDIIIGGVDDEDHDKKLDEVLRRMREEGATANSQKCEIGQSEIEFFGFHFSSDGVKVQLSKLNALQSASQPKTANEVRSFLGLASYCSRFIPQFSTIAKPLRELTKKNQRWRWSTEEEQSFIAIKNAIITNTTAYFDKDLKTQLTVDASPVGLGAVLTQYDTNKPEEKKIVTYISRTLSEVERRYSQIEKEALAIVWACERLHIYLYANKFEIITDNKAIELIFGNPASKPKARIERWLLRLLPYQFEITHEPGIGNIADYLSRRSSEDTDEKFDHEEMAEAYVNMITNINLPQAINRKEIADKTNDDDELIDVKRWIMGQPTTTKIKSIYSTQSHEFTITDDGILLKNNRVVIPKALQSRIVNIAHSGHMGIEKTKQLLRLHTWFPEMDEIVKRIVGTCIKCQANTKIPGAIPPIIDSAMPDGPWKNLSIDFYGPFANNLYLLVLVDDYSRYPFAKKITSLTARNVIRILNEIFASFGIPEKVKSDNGPPFNSHEFNDFAKKLNFKHHRITPYWPRANGTCERLMKSIGKIIRSANMDNSDWEHELTEFLRNYRATPHTTTKIPPRDLIFKTNSSTSSIGNIMRANTTKNESCFIQAELNNKKAKQARKERMKQVDKTSKFRVGELVLLKNHNPTKIQPLFDPNPYQIMEIKGTQVKIRRNRVEYLRNISTIKKFLQPQPLTTESESAAVIPMTPITPGPAFTLNPLTTTITNHIEVSRVPTETTTIETRVDRAITNQENTTTTTTETTQERQQLHQPTNQPSYEENLRARSGISVRRSIRNRVEKVIGNSERTLRKRIQPAWYGQVVSSNQRKRKDSV